ncbi:Cytoplasmic repetitive antigen (CRA) like repeat, putative [Plasmodium ovale]|uniref:Cytoplasmic repetitive antigen (CRA) like repeat, putative n=1 Tax=Plasmodium ovale TaxID=36330 RepID=A0A1C3L5I6_PLAOA|nr:Cytoplasmic repetitive antigen (CRA) like repeat, putative [Plasmodium ovale]
MEETGETGETEKRRNGETGETGETEKRRNGETGETGETEKRRNGRNGETGENKNTLSYLQCSYFYSCVSLTAKRVNMSSHRYG